MREMRFGLITRHSPIWDIIFGTYFMPKDRRPQVYGVSEKVPDGIILEVSTSWYAKAVVVLAPPN